MYLQENQAITKKRKNLVKLIMKHLEISKNDLKNLCQSYILASHTFASTQIHWYFFCE